MTRTRFFASQVGEGLAGSAELRGLPPKLSHWLWVGHAMTAFLLGFEGDTRYGLNF